VIMFNSGPPETLQRPASRRDLRIYWLADGFNVRLK
jgi:hypothetical protein